MSFRSSHAHGHPVAAAAVVGSFAFAIVLVTKAAGLLRDVESSLAQQFSAAGFGEFWQSSQPGWDLPMVAVLVYLLVWLLFETPGTGRRVVLLVTSSVLLLVMSPVLALWGVFWSPLNAVLGILWGGFCAILWARQHPMPCELPEEEKPAAPQEGKVIPINQEVPDRDVEEVPDESAKPAVAETGGGPGSGNTPGPARTSKRARGRGKSRRSRKR